MTDSAPGSNLFDLSGLRAIVTGGGGGIGAGLAAGLYAAGAEVLIIGRSESADEAAEKIGSAGRPVLARQIELTDRQALAGGFEEAVSAIGGINILVNCHGRAYVEPAVDFKLDEWDTSIETNLTSVFELCQLAGRHMVPQGSGKIINIASMLSYSGGLKAPAYAAAKGAIVQLTKALANEWSPHGINVNAIAPGYIRTKLNVHVWQDPVRSEATLARIPSGRWGEPQDLQGTAIFLASNASNYLHGITIAVDGGFLAR